MARVCWTYNINTWQTTLLEWGFLLFIFCTCKYFSISKKNHYHNFLEDNRNEKQENQMVASLYYFWIGVCPSIQNIVGTGFLKTTAVIRGLTFYFIKYCMYFSLHQQILRFFFLKKNSWEADRIQQKPSLPGAVFDMDCNCPAETLWLAGKRTSGIPGAPCLGQTPALNSQSLDTERWRSVYVLPTLIGNVEGTY